MRNPAHRGHIEAADWGAGARLRTHLVEDIVELDGYDAWVGRHLVRRRESNLCDARTVIADVALTQTGCIVAGYVQVLGYAKQKQAYKAKR